MKKNILYLFIAFLSFTFTGNLAEATTTRGNTTATHSSGNLSGDTTAFQSEKKDGVKTTAESSAKKASKRDIRKIKKAASDGHGGVYLSLGALILIIIILILIL